MVKRKKKVFEKNTFNLKKEHLYLVLFIVLGIVFLSLIGYNENSITSSAVNVGDSIGDALKIFTDILTPFFQAIGEDQNAIFLRLFYWLFLFFIISGIEGIRKKFGADETGAKRANIIAGIIALMAVVFTPVEFLILIGSSIFLIVVLGFMIGGLYWIYNFQRNQESRFTYFVKAFASLILFLLISAASSYASGKFSSAIGAGSVLNAALGIGSFVCVLFFVWYLFVKTLMGGPTDANDSGTPSTRQLKEAGGFYGGLAGDAAKGLGSGAVATGRGIRGWWRNRRQRQQGEGQPQQIAPDQNQLGRQPDVQQIKQVLMQRYFLPLEASHFEIVQQLKNANPNMNNIGRELTSLKNNSWSIIRDLENFRNQGNLKLDSKIVTQIMGLARSINTSSGNMLVYNDFKKLQTNYKRNMQIWVIYLRRAINNL